MSKNIAIDLCYKDSGRVEELEKCVCITRHVYIPVHVRGSFLIYCSLSNSLMSHSIPVDSYGIMLA